MKRRNFLFASLACLLPLGASKSQIRRFYLNTNDKCKFAVIRCNDRNNHVPLEKGEYSEDEVVRAFRRMNPHENVCVYHLRNLNGESNIFVTNDPTCSIVDRSSMHMVRGYRTPSPIEDEMSYISQEAFNEVSKMWQQ